MACNDVTVRVREREEEEMTALFTIVVMAFVVFVLLIAAYAFFEITPFAKHSDHYRDPKTGKRRGDSPRLD
jgi:hypothetical protein